MNVDPEKILEKLPRHTPSWAIGVTSVLVSLFLSLMAVYVTARPEFQEYLHQGYEERRAKATEDANAIVVVLGLVRSNAEQITELSRALNTSQENNLKLTERVSQIEKELIVTRSTLSDCEGKLRDLRK